MSEALNNILDTLGTIYSGVEPFLVKLIISAALVLAGVILIVNLHKAGFLRGNTLGIIAAALLLIGAVKNIFEAFVHRGTLSLFWLQALDIVLFAMVLVFIGFSIKTRLIVGGVAELAYARKKLAQQERWMRIMQEHISDGLAIYSNDGKLLYINPAAIRLLNGEGWEIFNIDVTFSEMHQPWPELLTLRTSALRGEGKLAKIEIEGTPGHRRVLEVRLSPVLSRLGRTMAICATYRDITEVERLEKAKEEFVQIASHELRTPLTAVKGFLSLLKNDRYGKLNGEQVRLIDTAVFASSRLSKLVDNLLMVARIEESKVQLNEGVVEIEEVISSVVQELAGEADRCLISLKTLPPGRKIPQIVGDREKIYHVLSNLISNAVKYTPEGGHVFVEPKVRDNHVEISVSDTGIGIEKKDLERLFRKFERIDTARAVRVGGSGLGLIIVKSFTELHGGQVTVQSRV